MASMSEITQLCRLCLIKDEVNVPIFQDVNVIDQIFLKISACLPIKVSKEDKLPKKICDACSYKLELFYDFLNTSKASEKQLRKWIDQLGAEKESSKGINPTTIILKQEIQDPAVDLSQDELSISTAAHNYSIQQQQLSYGETVEFELPQEGFININEASTVISSSRKRPAESEHGLSDDSEYDDDVGLVGSKITKMEDDEDSEIDADQTAFIDLPSGSGENDQAGPSGVGKETADAPCMYFDVLAPTPNEALSMSSKLSLLALEDAKLSCDLPDVNLLGSSETQLNETDHEILNLIVAEEERSAMLQNMTNTNNFENTINGGTDFIEEIPSFTNIEGYKFPDIVSDISNFKIHQTLFCYICDRIYTTKRALKNHLMSHFGNRHHNCDICNKNFKHKFEVTAHKLSHGQPTFQCEICLKKFIRKSHLTSHRRKHTGDYVVVCSECNKGFVTKSAYKKHHDRSHKNVFHVCEVCGLKLSSPSALKDHLLTHDPNYSQKRSCICDICGKSYLTMRNLRNHFRAHNQNKKYVCTICGKGLSSKNVLEVHLKIHIGDKPYVCEYCSKGFITKEYLEVHKRIHTGNKPFKCDKCDKSFTQKISLTVHNRSHTGERPYKCHCNKTFITKTHLLAHSKTHDVESIGFVYVAPNDM